MGKEYIKINGYEFPKGVYVPFGNCTEYNKLVLDYNISSNDGTWQFEFHNNVLNSEIPLTLGFLDSKYNYKMVYMDKLCDARLVDSNIITDILDIDFNNAIKYKLELHYRDGSYPIEEILCFLYEFFRWENVNIQYEVNEEANEVYFYIGTNIGWIDYGDSKQHWGVDHNSLNLDALCYRVAQLSQYYRNFLEKIDWFHVKLLTKPSNIELKFYNGDNTRCGRISRFNIIDLLMPLLYNDRKQNYTKRVVEYYSKLYEWISVAIQFGRYMGYNDVYFDDLKASTNDLISKEFKEVISESDNDIKNKDKIMELGIYDKVVFDSDILQPEDEKEETEDEIKIEVDKIEDIDYNRDDNVDIPVDPETSENIMGKVKSSIKNMSTLIDRM